MQGNGLLGCGRERRNKLSPTEPMLPAASAGVKAGMAHSVLVSGRSVPEHALDELRGAQSQRLALMIVVIGVAEADDPLRQVQRALIGQRPALGIASQVQRHAPSVFVRRRHLDIPMCAVVLRDRAVPVRLVLLGWQLQTLRLQGQPQLREQLAAEQVLQRLEWNEEALARGPPLRGRVDAPGCDEAVDMRVVAQGAAPRVQRHEQTRQRAEVPGFSAQCQQALACAVEEQLVHPRAVELPQRDERVRQREDDMEVRARQQVLELSGQPQLACSLGAAWAAAMTAGVVLHDRTVARGTRQHMAAQRSGVAVADRISSSKLARVQRARLRERVEVFAENGLQRAAHRSCRSVRAPAYSDVPQR